jgi:hypothetical protein
LCDTRADFSLTKQHLEASKLEQEKLKDNLKKVSEEARLYREDLMQITQEAQVWREVSSKSLEVTK